MKHLILAATLALAPAAARSQAAKADTVKLGRYELELVMDQGTLTGELVVKREKGEYIASVRAGGMTPEVRSFRRDGAEYVLKAGDASHGVTYTLTFVKDSVRGKLELGGGASGSVLGVFRP